MNLREALILVRDMYLEEERGASDGDVAQRYDKALAFFPVTMQAALILWAMQMGKQ